MDGTTNPGDTMATPEAVQEYKRRLQTIAAMDSTSPEFPAAQKDLIDFMNANGLGEEVHPDELPPEFDAADDADAEDTDDESGPP